MSRPIVRDSAGALKEADSLVPPDVAQRYLSLYEIPDGETVMVPAGHNFLVANDLAIEGELLVEGRLVEVG